MCQVSLVSLGAPERTSREAHWHYYGIATDELCYGDTVMQATPTVPGMTPT